MKKTREEIFTDYEGFVDKFKPKKTTDDCYTPPEVYDVVLAYVLKQCPSVRDLRVVRPFYPGGDYKSVDYSGAVVIDNPPFSMMAEIKRFFTERNIPFFLFAPHLHLFSTPLPTMTNIVTCARVIYENGADVSTSFVSNLFGSKRIIIDGNLRAKIEQAQSKSKKVAERPAYKYPKNVTSPALLGKFCVEGVYVEVDSSECAFIGSLDAQRPLKKSIYGNGFLLSDRVANELQGLANELQGLANELQGLAKTRARPEIEWTLSERERAIIEELNNGAENE